MTTNPRIDRIVTWLNPSAGLRRMQARTKMELLGSYVGASTRHSGLVNWLTRGNDPDADILHDLKQHPEPLRSGRLSRKWDVVPVFKTDPPGTT